MTNGILHVGFGKCGSSALQTAFCKHPAIKGSTGYLHYVALTAAGKVMTGNTLRSVASARPFQYVSSAPAKALARLSRKNLNSGIAARLEAIADNDAKVILSNELWSQEYQVFKSTNLLDQLNLECEVLIYVRPPVEWLNSAWWQWGAWSGIPFQRWVNTNLNKIKWYDRIIPWLDLARVKKIHVRLLPKDIVGDFCDHFDASPIESNLSNKSLPGTILRLFQRYPELRPGPHNPQIDFALAQHLGGYNGPVPWIVGQKLIQRTIQTTKLSNENLLTLLDAEGQRQMLDDPRWWSADHYKSAKIIEPLSLREIGTKELERLAVEALKAIKELDSQNRYLFSKSKGRDNNAS